MSKHLKKKIPPTPSSDDDELTQDLAVPGAGGPNGAATGGSAKVQEVVAGAGPTSSPGADDGWRHVAEQIDSLRAVLLNLVTLIAPTTAPGRPHGALPSGEDSLGQESAAIAASAGLPAIAAMRQDDAILGGSAGARREAAILMAPRETPVRGVGPDGGSGAGCSHRLPNLKKFSAGGDWRVFAWRFESAFCSIQRTEGEAVEALPTFLDDVSLAVFRSILAEKKATLREAFAEMAEVYEPPSDTHRKFVQQQRDGVATDPDKTSCIRDWPAATSVGEWQTGWGGSHCVNHSPACSTQARSSHTARSRPVHDSHTDECVHTARRRPRLQPGPRDDSSCCSSS
ncbi:unnamed protein product [Lampetra planeri]